MRWVQKVQTLDGLLHDNTIKAERHAESLYGLALCNLARQLVQIDKYRAMTEFVDANLAQFVALKALKDDVQLEKGDGDE